MIAEAGLTPREQLAADFHRPTYHFLPPSNWMNDPNGFIHWQGQYHLFYQYNPFGATWGNMHWGHAVSPNLVNWTDLPLALIPSPGTADESGCFSGCAVDDDGVPTFIYTGWQETSATPQTQCVATSRDGLLTWQKHPGNPVLNVIPPETGQNVDFRDPFVWKEADGWYMVLGSRIGETGGVVFLYRSADLATWDYIGPLFEGTVDRSGYVWECPNFFRLGDQWVLIISAHPLPGQTTGFIYYFVGSYANHRFTPVYEAVLDHDALYAPLSMLDAAGRRVMIGWIPERRSREEMTRVGWSGAQSIPRLLSLDAKNRLITTPVPELETLRRAQHSLPAQALNGETMLPLQGWALDMEAQFSPAADGTCGLALGCSADGRERTDLRYEAATQRLSIQTMTDGVVTASKDIPHPLEAGEALRLRLLLDGSVLEIIANGRTSLTHRLYAADRASNGLRLHGSGTRLDSLTIWEMASIW
jgi:beta-fructofuranosidase